MRTPTAFALAIVNTMVGPPSIVLVDLFSEETPTAKIDHFRYVTLLKGYGKDYQEGLCHLWRQMNEPQNHWIRFHLSARSTLDMNRARAAVMDREFES